MYYHLEELKVSVFSKKEMVGGQVLAGDFNFVINPGKLFEFFQLCA